MSLVGVFWGSYVERHPAALREMQRDLLALYEAGQIKPVVTNSWPLAEAPAAMRALAGRETMGKVVLTV